MFLKHNTPSSVYFLLMLTLVSECYSQDLKTSETIEILIRNSLVETSNLFAWTIREEMKNVCPELDDPYSQASADQQGMIDQLHSLFENLFIETSFKAWKELKTGEFHEAILETAKLDSEKEIDFVPLLINTLDNRHVGSEEVLTLPGLIKVIDEILTKEDCVIGSFIPIDDMTLSHAISFASDAKQEHRERTRDFIRKILKCDLSDME